MKPYSIADSIREFEAFHRGEIEPPDADDPSRYSEFLRHTVEDLGYSLQEMEADHVARR